MDIKITNISIKKIDKEDSRVKGYVTIILNDSLAIHDIRIIEGEKGLFIAMPSKKMPNDEYRDIVHPITQKVREMFEKEIIQEFNK